MKIKKLFIAGCMMLLAACSDVELPASQAGSSLNELVSKANVQQKLTQRGFEWGAPAFIRIFKEENILEVWLEREQGEYALFQQYPICTYSGDLGPKKREGDKQSPEGFYAFGMRHLNPNSRYHLSFNLNYPNAYDKAHGYTGSYLMVHGDCVSVGCYAMGNRQIEEIYTLVGSALQHGQPFVRVHAFPFRMSEENLARHQFSPHINFWRMLKPGYDAFERNHKPPVIEVVDGLYQLR
ncbi:murein L,D-transpeptidase [Cardiobacteriaceae bacterium TAE3-ERU3]|nr:murein L,D-transpeptidase [Cardiobacteriaceae bacterium TAE3-ERU3]